MGTLANDLGVARATLYRWFGSREALMEQVLLERAEAYIALARERSTGSGDERLIEMVRTMVGASRTALPVRMFIEREPQLALRILASERGRLHRFFVREAMRDLADTRTAATMSAIESRVDATIQLIAALIWMAAAIGEEPPLERIEALARELLSDQGRR
jgi:AcrR family transcriptional regulator